MLIDARLTDFKSVHFLCDAWWLKHPRERQFTWLSSNLSIASQFIFTILLFMSTGGLL